MKLNEINRIVDDNAHKQLFLVYGKDIYGLRRAADVLKIKLLVAAGSDALQLFDSDPTIDEFCQAAQSLPLFSSQNVIMLSDCKLFKVRQTDDDDGEQANAKQPADGWELLLDSLPEFTNLIIICRDNVDNRRRLYKNIAKTGCIIAVEPLTARGAREYFEDQIRQAGYHLENSAAQLLQSALENATEISLGLLDNELEKLMLFQGEDRLITAENLEKNFSASFNMSAFKFCDMLNGRKPVMALQLLEQLLVSGEPLLKLLSLCVRQYRFMAVAKELVATGSSAREIAVTLKVQPFVAENAIRDAKNYSLTELRAAICALAGLDAGLKNGKATTATVYALFTSILLK